MSRFATDDICHSESYSPAVTKNRWRHIQSWPGCTNTSACSLLTKRWGSATASDGSEGDSDLELDVSFRFSGTWIEQRSGAIILDACLIRNSQQTPAMRGVDPCYLWRPQEPSHGEVNTVAHCRTGKRSPGSTAAAPPRQCLGKEKERKELERRCGEASIRYIKLPGD